MKKALKYVLIILTSLVLLFFITGIIIIHFYEKDIQDFIVMSINKNLNSEVKVGEINITILKKFPDASIEFTDVLMKSTRNFSKTDFTNINTDTLFAAHKLFLQFNFWDIFHKRYKIKKISTEKGRVYLFTDNKGKDNFHFWKKSQSSDTSAFQLQLKKITLSDIQFQVVNLLSNIQISTHTKKFSISGNLSSDNYNLITTGDMSADKIKIGDFTLKPTENISANLKMNVQNNLFIIENGILSIADFMLDVSGKISTENNGRTDLLIKGKDVDIQSLLSVLPDKFNRLKQEYGSKGNFSFETQVSGTLNSDKFMHVDSKFEIKKGEILQSNSKIKLSEIFLEGTFSNGNQNSMATSSFNIQKFNANMGSGNISGTFNLSNFNHYIINLKADATMNLKELNSFLPMDTIKNIDGNGKISINYAGSITNPEKFSINDFTNSITSGTFILEKVNVELKNNPLMWSNINGIFTFNNNDLEINSLKFNIADNDFSVKGILKNIIAYLMIPNQNYEINGTVQCNKLNVGELIKSSFNSQSGNLKVVFPKNIQMNVFLETSNFIYNSFVAKNLKSTIIYNSKNLNFNDFQLNTLDGSVSGNARISQKTNDNISIMAQLDLQKININKTFTVFNNFGQDFIVDKNINGILSTNVTLSSEWSNNLTCFTQSLVANANLSISNGMLSDFKPLQEMAAFIDINELKNIRFSDIKNEIFIKDGIISIPQMNIQSSVLNLTLSGEQSFDSKIDYHVQILLSELLSKKFKFKKKENEEFGVIEDDGLGKKNIFLVISGTTDNFQIRYDRKKLKETVKESVNEEKNNLKNILHEEFGLFKKDSAMIVTKKNKEEEEKKKKKNKLKIKWDENSEPEKDKSDE